MSGILKCCTVLALCICPFAVWESLAGPKDTHAAVGQAVAAVEAGCVCQPRDELTKGSCPQLVAPGSCSAAVQRQRWVLLQTLSLLEQGAHDLQVAHQPITLPAACLLPWQAANSGQVSVATVCCMPTACRLESVLQPYFICRPSSGVQRS